MKNGRIAHYSQMMRFSCPRYARSEHASPVSSGGIEVFQRAWGAERSRSTVGRSEAGASSSQPRRAARHQPATFGALDARQARATRPQQPHVTKRRPQHHFAGQQAGGRVGFSWQHACGPSNGPPDGDLAIKKAGYGLLQHRTAGPQLLRSYDEATTKLRRSYDEATTSEIWAR